MQENAIFPAHAASNTLSFLPNIHPETTEKSRFLVILKDWFCVKNTAKMVLLLVYINFLYSEYSFKNILTTQN